MLTVRQGCKLMTFLWVWISYNVHLKTQHMPTISHNEYKIILIIIIITIVWMFKQQFKNVLKAHFKADILKIFLLGGGAWPLTPPSGLYFCNLISLRPFVFTTNTVYTYTFLSSAKIKCFRQQKKKQHMRNLATEMNYIRI